MKTTQHSMKALLATFVVVFVLSFNGFSQVQELRSFDRIIVSPRVQLELVKGDKESVRLEYENIDEGKVNVQVKGNTLRIYLDEAKFIVKNSRRGRYYDEYGGWDRQMYKEGVRVKAYVTYTDLKYLQIRGEEDIDINSDIENERFKLKAYGESTIRMKSITADKFKAVLIGENKLQIKGGKANKQKYKSIGDNWVRASGVDS